MNTLNNLGPKYLLKDVSTRASKQDSSDASGSQRSETPALLSNRREPVFSFEGNASR